MSSGKGLNKILSGQLILVKNISLLDTVDQDQTAK